MAVCTSCGTENPHVARFCLACGTAFDASAPTRAERKVVTVVFCDLVGSTAHAERLDPEDVQALLARFHERARSELQRYGGTVEKFIGDAVMALFGAPVAREDDPERAVRAAFALRSAIVDETELELRIGITTGEALVTLSARASAGEGMAAGDVVNTGARLQSAAPPNGILVDETTYRATERTIRYGEPRPLVVKGRSEPVHVREALEPKARFGVDVRQIGRTPLVGRERELQTLVHALERVRAEREPQLVTVVGEPGIGKSRLVWELFQHVSAGSELTFWRQGRSLPYGDGVSFWALGEMVKAQAGVLETDGRDAALAKLHDAVANLFEDEDEERFVERHLRPLLGLDVTAAPERRNDGFAAWRRFFEALAERRPLVLVFEDLHFADSGLLDFVDHLVDWAREVPILALATARPELLSQRPGWGGGKRNATTLSLRALTGNQTAELAATVLGRPLDGARLRDALIERSGGNPLYAEEFARLAHERAGDDELPMPETVQGLIAARIDALPTDEKALLQASAVVGKVFWLGAAAALTGMERWAAEEALHALEQKDFVRREPRTSVAGETEYATRHLLVRDVAYAQLPRAVRAEKHAQAAHWIESLGRREDHAEMLAHHYLNAIELARATSTSVDIAAARAALREAGDRAFALSAWAAAARYYDEALSLWPERDAGRREVLHGLARARHAAAHPETEETLERAAEEMLAARRPEHAAELETLLAELWWHRGNRDRCDLHLDRAAQLVEPLAPSAAKARVMSQRARYQALGGHYEQALTNARDALAMAEDLGLDEIRAHALNNIGISRASLGDVGGLGDLERARDVALASRSSEATRVLNNLWAMTWSLGDARRALEHIQEAVRVGSELGPASIMQGATMGLAVSLFVTDRWDEAFARAEELFAKTDTSTRFDNLLRRRALAYLFRDEPERALADIEQALAYGREIRDPQSITPTAGAAARIFVELGRTDDARALVDEVAHRIDGAAPWMLIDFAWVAEALELGDRLRPTLERWRHDDPFRRVALALLDRDYAIAAATYTEIGELDAEAVARFHAAEALAAAGRHAEAAAELDRARAFFDAVGATRWQRRAAELLGAVA